MSNINTLNNSKYYTLTGQQNRANSTSSNASDTLAQILNGTANNSGDIVDLSPTAQRYLNSLGSTGSLNSANVTSLEGQDINFILTSAQRQKLNNILAKYKDAPFTQETYNKIQDDLQAAGLSPDQLAKLDKVNAFNPTQVFIDIIDGKQTDLTNTSSTSDAKEKTKSDNYLKQILQQWKNLSSAATNQNTNTQSAGDVQGNTL